VKELLNDLRLGGAASMVLIARARVLKNEIQVM
jgi:hypothetical protein